MTQKLRGKMLRAIEMIAEGQQANEIEKTLGIRASTHIKWRRMPEFMARLEERKQALAEIRENVKQGIMSGLMQISGEAMRTQLIYKVHMDERFKNCLNVFKAVTPSGKDAQTYTNLHKDAQTSTNLHKPAQTSTNLHKLAPKMHQNTPV